MAYQGAATKEKDKNGFEPQVSQFANADAADAPSCAFDGDDKGNRTVPKGASNFHVCADTDVPVLTRAVPGHSLHA